MARRQPRSVPNERTAPELAAGVPDALPPLFGDDEPAAAQWGERLRRLALGATTALVSARAYWPGEDAPEGRGLGWVAALLVTAFVALAAGWISGTWRWRWSWADAAVLALAVVVGLSARDAADRRAAISVAWQWGGLAAAYLLLRSLPRDRSEASVVGGVLLATSVALATYGLFQVVVEDPELHARYRREPEVVLRLAGVPDDPVSRAMFEDRLLNSREPRSTFALTNSLAGFLVGPAVLGIALWLDRLPRRGRGRWGPLLLAVPPLAVVLVCLVLTKSRSAYLGLMVGLAVVAAKQARRLPPRVLGVAAAGVAALIVTITAAGLATGQLDREVLTEAPKSLQYRAEYWQATWALIRESPRVFWYGIGPGNFQTPYLRHKLATSSEEISDPHDLLLEAWVTSGLPALLLLGVALGLGLWNALAPRRAGDEADFPAEPPGRPGVLWFWGAAGLLLVVLLGDLNPFSEDGLRRWFVLGWGWALGALMLGALWRTGPVPAFAAGAGALAVAVNLLAAGGIAMAPVAVGLWALLALGQDLRADRACARLRPLHGHRLATSLLFFPAVAVLGTFFGAVVPQWRADAELEAAQRALESRSPDEAAARAALVRAAQLDPLSSRPWVRLAELEYRSWWLRQDTPPGNAWVKIGTALDAAVAPPRNPRALGVLKTRMMFVHQLLGHPAVTSPELRHALQADLARTSAQAVSLYPNSAALRAELAEAAAASGRTRLAAAQAREALRLDQVTPHAARKLPDALRTRLREALPAWEAPPAAPRTPPSS